MWKVLIFIFLKLGNCRARLGGTCTEPESLKNYFLTDFVIFLTYLFLNCSMVHELIAVLPAGTANVCKSLMNIFSQKSLFLTASSYVYFQVYLDVKFASDPEIKLPVVLHSMPLPEKTSAVAPVDGHGGFES